MGCLKIFVIACLFLLCGCVFFEKYTTEEVITDPDTGKQTVVYTEYDSPAVQVFKSAVRPLSSGDWIGAAIAAVTTGVSVTVAAMKARSAKKSRRKAEEKHAVAVELATFGEAAKRIALHKDGEAGQLMGQLLEDAAKRQNKAGLRDPIRAIRADVLHRSRKGLA